jgi:hypothetical protein
VGGMGTLLLSISQGHEDSADYLVDTSSSVVSGKGGKASRLTSGEVNLQLEDKGVVDRRQQYPSQSSRHLVTRTNSSEGVGEGV